LSRDSLLGYCNKLAKTLIFKVRDNRSLQASTSIFRYQDLIF